MVRTQTWLCSFSWFHLSFPRSSGLPQRPGLPREKQEQRPVLSRQHGISSVSFSLYSEILHGRCRSDCPQASPGGRACRGPGPQVRASGKSGWPSAFPCPASDGSCQRKKSSGKKPAVFREWQTKGSVLWESR